MGRPKQSYEAFSKKLNKSAGENGCWPWIGAVNRRGYGVTSINHRLVTTHRLAYFYEHGSFPDGLCVCHRCDNPPCCNPAHLFIGTTQDNTADMVRKKRQSSGEKHSKAIMPGRYRGIAHYAAKMTEAEVLNVRRLFDVENLSPRSISKTLNLPWRRVQKIAYRQTWKHI